MCCGGFLQIFETLPDSILLRPDEYLQFRALSKVAGLADAFQKLVQEMLSFTDKLVLEFACYFLTRYGRNNNARIPRKKHVSQHQKLRIAA